MVDNVNHPKHYQSEEMEVIDVIQAFCNIEEVCKGNVIKYVLRAGKKDDIVQDLEKARWYLNRWIVSVGGIVQDETDDTTARFFEEDINKYKEERKPDSLLNKLNKQFYNDVLDLCNSYSKDVNAEPFRELACRLLKAEEEGNE